MQFSENWLRTFVNPDMDSEALGHALTMAGLEVEEMETVAPPFNHVVIGEIVSAEKHPDADRLQLCKVNVGDEELQIVCGAPNARVGIKVPCAMVGAKLPEFKIKKAKVRGVESFGMLCSAKEIGIAEDADGLLELPADAPLGSNIREYLDLDDVTYAIKLTPNRADCLSLQGVARDVTAMTGATFTPATIPEIQATSLSTFPVLVNEVQACPAYYGRVIEGVNASVATPDWMVQRLERSGIRSISVVVDITNYVLLELGQPLHAFDFAKLSNGMHVRYAEQGEKVTLLNEQEVTLANDDLVIADSDAPLALAGIMGGSDSAVSDATNTIFLESAFFTPDVMAGKARRHGLSTDSSYRFERGVDFGNTAQALERATGLILDICGGEAGNVTAAVSTLPSRATVTLRHQRLESVLGINISVATVSQLFSDLGFTYTEQDGVFTVQAPSYRFDILREVDLIEEVARLHGYDKIPAITPEANLSILPQSESELPVDWVRESMQAQGYQEVVTYSFVDAKWEHDLLQNPNPIQLKNPIVSHENVMRTSLWGGLIQTLSYNINRKQDRAMLFELGSTYHEDKGDYQEYPRVAGLLYGAALPEQWAEKTREADFFDVKATVESLTHGRACFKAEKHPALHPGQSARVYLNDQPIGWVGKLHPKWQQQYDLPKATFLFELTANDLRAVGMPAYTEVAKSLPARRDIAVLVEDDVTVQSMVDAVNTAKIPLLQQIQLFDVYQGQGVPEGKKSLAFLALMQDTHKTLVDADTEATVEQILDLLKQQFGAVLR